MPNSVQESYADRCVEGTEHSVVDPETVRKSLLHDTLQNIFFSIVLTKLQSQLLVLSQFGFRARRLADPFPLLAPTL